MSARRRVELAVRICHALLIGAVSAAVATAAAPAAARALMLAIAAAPLLLAVPGLRRGRRYTQQWLALALVPYAGLAAVEVVATLGGDVFAGAVLFAALLELALLLALIRSPARRPATRE